MLVCVLPQTTAETRNIDRTLGVWCDHRAVQDDLRSSRGACACECQSTPVVKLSVGRCAGNGILKCVASVPRRAAVEVRANRLDARNQDPCASAIDARNLRVLISVRNGAGNASSTAAACRSSALLSDDCASADV